MKRLTEQQQLAAETEMAYRQFAYWPTTHHYTCGVLFTAAASLRDQTGEYKPYSIGRPLFISNDGDTGKSLSTKVMCRMIPGGRVVLNPTSHGLIAQLNVFRECPGVEEVDKKLGMRGVRNQDTMAVILGGYQKGADVLQQRNDNPDFPNIHGPMVLNGNNASMILNSQGYQPLRTRCYIFLLDRKPENVELITYDPELHDGRLLNIRGRWAKWGINSWRNVLSIPENKLRIDKRIQTRQREIWRPLFRVAHYLGGDWPKRCEAAARAFALGIYEMDDTPAIPPSEELLMEVRAQFRDDERFLPTKVILRRLMENSRPESWWMREWNNPQHASMGLADVMRIFDIEGERQSYKGKQERGYALDSLDTLDSLDSLDDDSDAPLDLSKWDWDSIDA